MLSFGSAGFLGFLRSLIHPGLHINRRVTGLRERERAGLSGKENVQITGKDVDRNKVCLPS